MALDLQAKFDEPLYKDNSFLLTKYQHVERMGNENVEGILNGEILVQTKVDGANVTVCAPYDPARSFKDRIIIASRNQIIYKDGKILNNFEGAVDYIINNSNLLRVLQDYKYVLRGEWLVKHSILYNQESYRKYYVFDVQDYDMNYIHPDDWQSILADYDVNYIKNIARLPNPSIDYLAELVKGPDEYGASQKEGIVIKNYSFVNKFGRITWGKMISDDFKIKSKLAFGSTKNDSPEIKFVGDYITHGFILKTIHKIEEQKGVATLPVQYMRAVLDMTWYDAFTEELWDFVKREHVKNFDFQAARKLCETKTREVALAYFNGIPEMIK